MYKKKHTAAILDRSWEANIALTLNPYWNPTLPKHLICMGCKLASNIATTLDPYKINIGIQYWPNIASTSVPILESNIAPILPRFALTILPRYWKAILPQYWQYWIPILLRYWGNIALLSGYTCPFTLLRGTVSYHLKNL